MPSYDQLNERAFILPVFGFLILTPPLLLLFNNASTVFGIPVLYLYAFFAWAILIFAGKLLANKLHKEDLKRNLRRDKRNISKNQNKLKS